MAVASTAFGGSVNGEVLPLRPGAPVERELEAGAAHRYLAELSSGELWRVTVEQIGIDVTVALVPTDGGPPSPVDSPLDRAGIETLAFRSEANGRQLLEVRSREPRAPAGRYRIELRPIPETGAAGRLRSTAELARSQAARLYAAARPREALDAYRESLRIWRELGDEEDIAREVYCVAVLLRLVSQPQAALASAREALYRWRALGARHWEAATLNELGLDELALGDVARARETFENALELRREIGDRLGIVKTRNNLCLTYLSRGSLRRGLDCYQPIFADLEELGEDQLTAIVHLNVAWAWARLGEPDPALDGYGRALELLRLAGDRKGEAQALNNLGQLHQSLGHPDPALASYEPALAIFRELDDLRWQGTVLHNLGHLYAELAEPQRALAFLHEALDLRHRAGNRQGEITTLNSLGKVCLREGQPEDALGLFRRALELARQLGQPRLEGIALTQLAAAKLLAGALDPTLEHARNAVELLRQAGDRPREAEALHVLGLAQSQLGQARQAIASLGRALELRRAVQDRAGEVATLTARARAERLLGSPSEAKADLQAAIQLSETLRARIGTADLRASAQGSRREAYELLADLLMEEHRNKPSRDFDRTALELSERARSRALLDLLEEAGASIRQGVDPALLERRAALHRRLDAKAWQASIAERGSRPEDLPTELDLASVLTELDRVENEIRRTSPRFAELTRPSPLSAAAIQGLLDPDTLLLEFLLAEERSFLFLVATDRLEAFELPGRATIEAAARKLYGHLVDPEPRDRGPQAAAAADLAEMLLGQVSDRLGDRRLAIVADGALHFVPFAALPLPGAEPPAPLVTRHEIVHLPSASVLAAQRRELADRPTARGWLAVVADPVFTRPDSAPAAQALPRLPGSRREAAAILALVPPGSSLALVGLDAQRTQVTSGTLRDYRIVHFATHGRIDARTPRLSGLALSSFDALGRPREGFLHLHDIYELRLGADLVALSGCETALGKNIVGEGLVGLTRGFMYAGARRVLASLWKVEDLATAELMTRFYRAMLKDDLAPAAALRSAQLSIRGERRWRDPYFWSGFVLQGDWRVGNGETFRPVVPLTSRTPPDSKRQP